MIKLYNTLTRKKETFKPLIAKKVGIYSCGPTVYWFQHIGNMRMYLNWDILKRILKFNGFKIKHVINVTDVGHLVSDADTGEDKMEKAAKREGRSAKEIAGFYFKVFRDDLRKLNIIEADVWPKASEHIKEQIDFVKTLEKKGFTYKTGDGIYFNTSKLKDYGKLARLKIKDLRAGKRVSLKEKKNKTDFALWLFSEKPGQRQQEWKSPWGIGWPGWHLECSAMSMKYLGKHFDIHTGGMDHIPIHHTNEIAVSEAAFGKQPWVNYWLHGAWLLFKGEKVSKSSGKILKLSDLEKMGFNTLDFRYMILATHYRKPLNFDINRLKKAKQAYQRLKNIIAEIKDDKKTNKKYLDEFKETINDDLNTPEALQVLWKLARDKKASGKIATISKMDNVLGLNLLKKEKIQVPRNIKFLIKQREAARKSKDWKKADKIRIKIRELGYLLEDTPKGAVVKKL